jgi:lysophospholipase L1-like esterase
MRRYFRVLDDSMRRSVTMLAATCAAATAVVVTALAACGGDGDTDAAVASSIVSTTSSATESTADNVAVATTTIDSSTTVETPLPSMHDTPGVSLVVIGDSLPFGGHFCGGCRDLGEIYAEMVQTATGKTVTVTNRSSDQGIDSKQLLQAVRTDEVMRTALAGADIVVVSSGHNDTPWNVADDPCDGPKMFEESNWTSYTPECSSAAAAQYRPVLDGVLDEIATLREGKPTVVRVLTFYNDLVGWPPFSPENETASVNVIDAFDSVICDAAAAHEAACVDVYHAFNGADGRQPAGDLLEGDYTHPNQAGHQKIAEVLFAAGIAPLQ